MLSEGKITTEEAEQLLEALDRSRKAEQEEAAGKTRPPSYPYERTYSKRCAEKVQEEIVQSLPLQPGSTVTIHNPRGSVKVKTWEKEEAEIKAVKVAWGITQEAARSGVEGIEIKVDERSEELLIEAVMPDRSPLEGLASRIGKMEVHFDLTLPKKVSLDMTNAQGDVCAGEIEGEVKVANSRGEIKLSAISGSAEVRGDRSPISLEKIGRDARIMGSRGPIVLDGVGGEANIASERGAVHLRTVGGRAQIRNSREAIIVEAIGSDLEVQSDRGAVQVKTIGGNADIRNDRQATSVQNVEGNVTVESDRGPVRITEVRGKVSVRNDREGIVVRPIHKIEHPYTLETGRNSIDLRLPPDSAVSLYVKAHRGKIETDLPLSIRTKGRTTIVEGDLNGGGPEVRILTDRGNIRLSGSEQSSVASESVDFQP
jgi:DUF4097 and DUF4098 domain-containing protein YvlB